MQINQAKLFHFSLLGKREEDLDFTVHFSIKVQKIFFSHFQFPKFQYLLSQNTDNRDENIMPCLGQAC